MKGKGVQSKTSAEDLARFDAELKEYYANKSEYKYITPRDENMSWLVRVQNKKICRGAKSLAEAVTVRNQLIEL